MADQTPQPPPSYAHQAASGVVWVTAQKWAVRIVGFVTIAILTRILRPEDFGTVAAASAVLPFFYLLADLGFSAYIIQAKDPEQSTLSTSFWFSSVAGLVLCGVLVAIAEPLASLMGNRQVAPVLQVLSLVVIPTALAAVPTALLRRDMRFRILAIQTGIASLAAQVVAIAMTFAGLGVWALVGQAMVSPVLVCVMVWRSARWRPGLVFSGGKFRRMARYGSQVIGVDFVGTCRALGEAAIVSAALGPAALGYLTIAQRLVQIVQDLTGSALVPVTTVAFAKIRESVDRLRNAYLRALRLTYAVMSLPLSFVAVAAPLIIPILFGDGWAGSERVAQVLAFAGILVVGANLDNGFFYGLGRAGRWLIYGLVVDAVTLGTTWVASGWGLDAVAYGFLGVAVLATIGRWFLIAPLLDARPLTLARPAGAALVASLAASVAGFATASGAVNLHPIIQLVLIGLTVVIVYAVVVKFLAPAVVEEILGFLNRFRRSRWHRKADVEEDS